MLNCKKEIVRTSLAALQMKLELRDSAVLVADKEPKE